MRLKLNARGTAQDRAQLATLVRDFRGVARLRRPRHPLGPRLLELGPEYRVRPDPDFFAEVKHLLGEAAVL